MKRFILFICLILGMIIPIVAEEQSNTSTYTLSRETFNAAKQDEDGKKYHLWHFQIGNCTLSLMNGVGGESAGNPAYNDDRIAFFEGVQFQLIGIPENESITSVTFEGNGVNKTCYLTEMDGTSYGTSDGAKSLNASSNAQSIAFDFESNPIGRNFTFTFSEATAQISQIVIKTKKLETLTAYNHTWDFNEWLQAGNNGFTFGKTALKGYAINTNDKGTTYYDSGSDSQSNGFRAITMAEPDRELTSTQGIQVNGRSQLYNNAISILSGNCIKFHVEKGQQIVFNIHSHLSGNSVTYSLSTDASNETFATDAIIDEWGHPVKGSVLTSQAQDIKLVALESGDFIIKNVSNTFIYVQKIELSNFKPNVIWSDKTPLVNTATEEKDFTKDMALSFPSNNHVKFAITECGEGTATWKSFNTKTGKIKGINGKGGLLVKAYFPTSNYFTYAENTYVLNVTKGIHFAEKTPSMNWSKQGYVTYAQKLVGDGLTFSAAPIYEVINKPAGWKAQISQDSGSPDYVLSVLGSGSGTVTVKGTFGEEYDTYDLYISGLNFGNNSPSIAYGTTEYEQGVIEAQDARSSIDVTYSLGTAVGVTAQIDATTGKLTNISGSGAIQVIAKSKNSDLEAEYVLTVGCDPSKKKVWDFYSNQLTLTPKGLLGDTPQAIGDATTTNAESAVYDKKKLEV